MANEQHLHLLLQRRDHWEDDRRRNPQSVTDLREADLSDVDLSGRTLTCCMLDGAKLRRANLQGATLTGAVLNGADMTDAILTGAVIENARLVDVELFGAVLDKASISANTILKPRTSPRSAEQINCSTVDCAGGIFDGTSFNRSRFEGVNFCGANLQRTTWIGAQLSGSRLDTASLDQANFGGARLNGVNVATASLVRTQGLFGEGKATIDQVDNAQEAYYSTQGDTFHWERLRWIGQFRFFAVSNFSLLAIVLYVLAADWYNSGLQQIRTTAEGSWAESLLAAPLPPRLGVQLVTLVGLALASTIFELRCPDLVKEYSETRWTRELGNPLIEYRSAKFSYPISRSICVLLYAVGGLYTLINVGERLLRAIVILVT